MVKPFVNMQNRPCPVCKKKAAKTNRFFPFCSERCKLIDLGKWAMEQYRIPGEKVRDKELEGEKEEEEN